MRIRGMALLFACLIFLSMSSCQAEELKDEWKNPDINFHKIKTVLVITSADPNIKFDQSNSCKLEASYLNVFFQDKTRWEKSSFQFITLNQLKDRISKATGEDMKKLEAEDPVRYKSEMDTFTPIIVDAILNSNVTSFGYDQRFVAETTETYTEQVETEVDIDYVDSNGQWAHQRKTVTVPVEKTRIIPAHYDTYGNAGMSYTLIDMKTNKPIWMLRDIREACGKDPIDMIERIMNRSVDCLAKI